MEDKNALEMINTLIAAGHSGSLEEIKKKLECPKKRRAWRTELEETYYFIDSNGFVTAGWNGKHKIDKFRIGTGNCYQTEEEAKIALKIINRIIELRDGWTPDWEDSDQDKHMIYFDFGENKRWSYLIFSFQEMLGSIYLPTKEAAKALIDEFGDDLFLISGRI